MKILKRIAIGLVILPFALILLVVGFEIVGMTANHISTERQTRKLEKTVTSQIADAEIQDVRSFTGNTGNGNHVDCVSEIDLTADISADEIKSLIAPAFDGKAVTVSETDGGFMVRVFSSAPFPDNIEGH